jgi:hypothetical protein
MPIEKPVKKQRSRSCSVKFIASGNLLPAGESAAVVPVAEPVRALAFFPVVS